MERNNVISRDKTDEAMRGAILALKASTTWSSSEISAVLGVSLRQVNRIYSRSLKNGFDPSVRPLQINNSFVSDRPRSGRPKKRTEEVEQAIAENYKRDSLNGEKSCADIAAEITQAGHPVSSTTVWHVLKDAGLRKSKPIKKRGPRMKMKESTAESVHSPYALALERREEGDEV
ncbi:hypothetical protein CI102_9815 [Trichoderma harzianum]|uniref:Transposase Tc1-like domain-containing protein n=1 Tax=Trichoderma harzianum CBS 226.95 TaxID=983964 RepID=A0A2T4A9N9_TRIHA|nr:hypothetical protein M431DRAFT_508856 [Trichoderma harzianum CBS 226.95]PKK45425.1 hypothetical protein CI102_9815 [Trichoderma harzianum]PTB53787.1 hypothetical protein M431DRAFT_508856 [Trichoderma harzianum CBS 226.95]